MFVRSTKFHLPIGARLSQKELSGSFNQTDKERERERERERGRERGGFKAGADNKDVADNGVSASERDLMKASNRCNMRRMYCF